MKVICNEKALCLGILISLAGGAEAAVIGCNTDATPSVLAVNNSRGAYCVSDYGWSNTWYTTGSDGTKPIPSVYTEEFDLFSGDDAVNLSFSTLEGTLSTPVTGSGWLTPTLDAGALFPFYPTGSEWTVVNPVAYVTPGDESATQSMIRLALTGLGSVDVTIDTQILGDGGVKQFYTIQNNADTFLTDLVFTDYFNFHPNGSLVAATKEGTTSFNGEKVTTTGNKLLPSFVGNGTMNLIDENGALLVPTVVDIGCADVLGFDLDCTGVGATIPRVEAGAYNGLTGPLGPGDYAAALGYAPGNLLGPEESITFGVEKHVVPAPGSLALFGLGLVGLGVNFRARRAAHGPSVAGSGERNIGVIGLAA